VKKSILLVAAVLALGVTACSGGSATTTTTMVQAVGTGLSGVQADVHRAPG